MTGNALAPIPVSARQLWRDLRTRWLPVVVFAASTIAIAALWSKHVAAPTFVGQAEPYVAQISSHEAGILVELRATRFQKVKAGDTIARVLMADPRVLESSLAVVRAEIEALRVGQEPIADQQRNALDYGRLKMDWMKHRADLAAAQVKAQLAETELHRSEKLAAEGLVSEQTHDLAKAAHESLQREVGGLTGLVAECEQSLTKLRMSKTGDISSVSDGPVRAAIAVQENQLRLVEAELGPMVLRAPIDGTVSEVFYHAGEALPAGLPIVSIASASPTRIVGYLRPPILDGLQAGMAVEVRTRTQPRATGRARIVEVGSQLEILPEALAGPTRLTSVQLGLPVEISLPANLRIRPGELVDIALLTSRN
jgi:multidrug resistance efflux pump